MCSLVCYHCCSGVKLVMYLEAVRSRSDMGRIVAWMIVRCHGANLIKVALIFSLTKWNSAKVVKYCAVTIAPQIFGGCKIMVRHIRLNKKCTSCNNCSLMTMWIWTWSKRTGGHNRSQNCLNCHSCWLSLTIFWAKMAQKFVWYFSCTQRAAQWTLWLACQFLYVVVPSWLHGYLHIGDKTVMQGISHLIWTDCAWCDPNTANQHIYIYIYIPLFGSSLHYIEIWWIKRVIICERCERYTRKIKKILGNTIEWPYFNMFSLTVSKIHYIIFTPTYKQAEDSNRRKSYHVSWK